MSRRENAALPARQLATIPESGKKSDIDPIDGAATNNGGMHMPKRPDSISRQELLRRGAEIAQFCAAHAAELDQSGSFPEKEFAKIISHGLLVAPLSSELGGLGLGFES